MRLKKIQEVNTEYAKLQRQKLRRRARRCSTSLTTLKSQLSCVGSTAGTLKVIVDQLRQEGIKARRSAICERFRPFPVEELRSALKNVKTMAVMDKSMSFGGFGGAVFNEVRNALYDAQRASNHRKLHFRFRRKRHKPP